MMSRRSKSDRRSLWFIIIVIIALVGSFFPNGRLLPAKAQDNPSAATNSFEATIAIDWMTTIYQVVEREAICAPCASRLYAYAAVALYEAVEPGIPNDNSMAGQLNAMPDMPFPDETLAYDWPTVANEALAGVMGDLFSTASDASKKALADVHDKYLADREQAVKADVLKRSKDQGAALSKALLDWLSTDGYKETRGKPFQMQTGEPWMWVPTTPGQKPVEPFWGTLRPFAMTSDDACFVKMNLTFSTDPNSTFYLQAKEVQTTRENLTEEQKAIATNWIDSPGQTGTPSGHWVMIETQIIGVLNLKLGKAAEMFALVNTAMADGFISAWETKYRIPLLRPETYIKTYIRRSWAPFVQTPGFPEYPSGHSVVSQAAATVLTTMFGQVAFTDNSVKTHNLPPRSFTSFQAAASEAGISRLYGGIHYRTAIENGFLQGRCVAQNVLNRIQLRPTPQGE